MCSCCLRGISAGNPTLDETSALVKPLSFFLGEISVQKRSVLSCCLTSASKNLWVHPSTVPSLLYAILAAAGKWCRDVALVQTHDSLLLLLSTQHLKIIQTATASNPGQTG